MDIKFIDSNIDKKILSKWKKTNIETYEEMSELLEEICCRIAEDIGSGFSEKCYQMALVHILKSIDWKIETEHEISIVYRNEKISSYRIDIFISLPLTLVIEIKIAKNATKKHENQLFEYMKHSDCNQGCLIYFPSIIYDFDKQNLFDFVPSLYFYPKLKK
jgi:GxxExxY protein